MRKRILDSTIGIVLAIGMLPIAPMAVIAASDGSDVPAAETDISDEDSIPEAEEVEAEDQVVVSPTDTLYYLMDVRWGNVRGDVEYRDEMNFDGSVSAPSTSRLALRKELLFEDNDSITSEEDPVSWTSLITGHMDGVRVAVAAPANDIITITTTQGTLAKTAKEFFESDEPIVSDLGSGREIVVKSHPLKSRTFFLALGWGNTTRFDNEALTEDAERVRFPRANFSGSIEITDGSKMKPVRPLRFERRQGDKIVEHDKTHVVWKSFIRGGIDGLLVRLHPDRNSAKDKLTVRFSEFNFEQSWTLAELFESEKLTVNVPVPGNDQTYELVLRKWRYPNRKLVRAKKSDKVFVIEGDEKRHVVSADAFGRSGLKWEDVEVVDDEDVDAYVDGSPFGYDDGMLIKGSGDNVWVVSNGRRRHVSDPAAFERLGYDWNNLIVIPDADVEQYPEDDQLAGTAQAPEGALLRVEGDPKVYVVEGGRRRHVPNPDVFAARRLRWNSVQVVSADVVDELPVSDALNYPDGAVVRAPDGRVYEIEDGERRYVASAGEFLKRGHKWEDVREADKSLIDRFDDGENVELLDDVPTL